MNIFAEISEYVGQFEMVQGNVNASGLVWEHDIEESISLTQDIYLRWIEQIADGFDLKDTLDESYHVLLLEEILTFQEIMGNVPLEVYHANINVVHERKAAPVKVWWVGANVIHGPDTFYEDVVENCHFRSTYVQAVPYYWIHLYESIDFEFHNIPPEPAIIKSLHMETGDLVNLRHNVIQEYYFNSVSNERIFIYDSHVWGWKHDIEDQVAIGDYAIRELGFKLIDYLFPQDQVVSAWKGSVSLEDWLFTWDKSKVVNAWPEIANEEVALNESVKISFFEKILELLGISVDLSQSNWINQLTVEEQIIFSLTVTMIKQFMPKVLDEPGFGDNVTSYLVKTYTEFLDDGIDFYGGIS